MASRLHSAGRVGRAQRLASLAVLAALCALAAWILAARTQLNPAVEAALRAPVLAGTATGAPAQPGLTPAAGEAGAVVGAEAGQPGQPGQQSQMGKIGGLAALLPDAAAGLKPVGPAEAFSPATLSDKIDGKAELYLAAGFAGMACRSYATGRGGRVELYLYRMKGPEAAFAVFSGQRRPGAAASPLAKNAYLTENALFFIAGRDYVEVIADRAGVKDALEGLGKAVLAALGASPAEGGKTPDAAAVQPQDLFPLPGLKADSIRLAVADAFGCQGLTNIYSAEYDASAASVGAGATAFLSRRKDGAEAQAQAKLYQRFLTDNGYAPKADAGGPAGATVLVMEGSVEIVLARGRWLAGVHDAPDLAVALKLAAALDEILKAKGGAQ